MGKTQAIDDLATVIGEARVLLPVCREVLVEPICVVQGIEASIEPADPANVPGRAEDRAEVGRAERGVAVADVRRVLPKVVAPVP